MSSIPFITESTYPEELSILQLLFQQLSFLIKFLPVPHPCTQLMLGAWLLLIEAFVPPVSLLSSALSHLWLIVLEAQLQSSSKCSVA